MLNTSFICPYMNIRLKDICKLYTCPYNKSTVASNCIWEYITSKNSISITELSIILSKDIYLLNNIVDSAILKTIEYTIKNKINNNIINIKYCNKCGKAYNLIFVDNNYICYNNCYTHNIKYFLENKYKKPISHILMILADCLDINNIARLLKMNTKEVKKLYALILGDYNILTKLKNNLFCKRKKVLKFKKIGRRPKSLSFSSFNRKINLLNGIILDKTNNV